MIFTVFLFKITELSTNFQQNKDYVDNSCGKRVVFHNNTLFRTIFSASAPSQLLHIQENPFRKDHDNIWVHHNPEPLKDAQFLKLVP